MRIFLSLFSTLVLLCAVIVGGYWRDAYVSRPAENAQFVAFIIQSGESAKSIASRLKESGVIDSAASFELFARLNDAGRRLQAGAFQLKPGMSFVELVETLSNAKNGDVQVTIPEGYTSLQIGAAVRAVLPQVDEGAWKQAVGVGHGLAFTDGADKKLSEDLVEKPMEGFLFPDTYRFLPDTSARDVAQTLFRTFLAKTEEAGIRPNEQGIVAHRLSLYEFVTLASIIEREVQRPEEMRIVADIFLRRLDAGMALQADSTINYVTGGTSPSVSREETEIDSPYNTYRVRGLPPTPISNPGLNAMLAVQAPTANTWLYFLTTPEGDVKYAKTYEEHLANKQKYLR